MTQRLYLLVWSLLAVALTAQAEPAQAMPGSRTQTYSVRFDPENPSSQVHWSVELHLTPQQVKEDEVDWLIDSIEITEYSTTGFVLRIWSKANPMVLAPNGLWTVTHANPEAPTVEEFHRPPLIEDTLEATFGGEEALDIEWEGVGSSEPLATYRFALPEEEEPLDEDEEVPVGSGGGQD